MIQDNSFIGTRKLAIIMAVIVIVLGTVLYFGTGAYQKSSMTPQIDRDVLALLQYVDLKAAYNDNGHILIFVSARPDYIKKLNTDSGKPLPEEGELVIGDIEGLMMREKKLFNTVGDKLEDLGLTFTVVGILSKTNTFVDDFHFVNIKEYNLLPAEPDKLFVKFKDAKTPKLFYLYSQNIPSPVNVSLSEGRMTDYHQKITDTKIYYPIIIGYDEAKMMREEKLFTNTGDTLDDFFGRDVIIVGIMEKTNTGMDMMHIVEPDFFEGAIVGVLA